MAKSAASSSSKKSKASVAPAPAPASSSAASSSEPSSDETSSGSESEEDVPLKKADAPFSTRYTPPEGFKLVTDLKDMNPSFDWDAINNAPDDQLWAIRLPKGLKAKHLEGMQIKLPSNLGKPSSSALAPSSSPIGTFTRKGLEYAAFIVADLDAERAVAAKKAKDKGKRKREEGGEEQEEEERDFMHGGQELRSVVPLLPKHSAGNKLFAAPRPLSLALSIVLRPPPSVLPNSSTLSSLIASQPSPVPGAVLTASELLDPEAIQAKKKHRTQPSGLRMRLQLPGTRSVQASEGADDRMEVDTEAEEVAQSLKVEGKAKKTEEEKREKRERKEKKEKKKVKAERE